MKDPVSKRRGWLWSGALGLLLLSVLLSSCQRKVQISSAPPPPPPPNYMEQGDQFLQAGDYSSSVSAYSTYLSQNPAGMARDRALFQLGLLYSLPSNPSRDIARALSYFGQLSDQFPESPLRPQAELVSGLQRQIEDLEQQAQRLRRDVEQREVQLSAVGEEVEALRRREAELMQLHLDVKSRDERIQQLSQELERLKAIDMQRRPAPRP